MRILGRLEAVSNKDFGDFGKLGTFMSTLGILGTLTFWSYWDFGHIGDIHTTTAEYQVFNVAVSNAETDRCLP